MNLSKLFFPPHPDVDGRWQKALEGDWVTRVEPRGVVDKIWDSSLREEIDCPVHNSRVRKEKDKILPF